MYVRLPEEAMDSFTLKFSYRGSGLVWTFFAIFCIIVILILDYLFLKKKLNILLSKAFKKISFKKWWEDEEE